MKNLEVLTLKLTELLQKKVKGHGQTYRPTDRPTDICITRAPMELKNSTLRAHLIYFGSHFKLNLL